jgi:hypothetical protein
MAINDGFYWYKNVLKKQLKLASRIYLSIAIVLAPIFLMSSANAANVGGWSLGNPIAQGASAVVNATKTAVINGANVIKNSTAKITPPASQVAKVLARGAAGYALSVAVEQLLGSVDWVLDPANNQIKYKLPSDPTGAYLYNRPSSGPGGPFIYTLSQAQSMVCQTVNSISNSNYKLTNCNITGVNTSNPAKPIFYFTYDQINSNGSQERGKSSYYDSYGRAVAETPEEEKTIPLETVAQKVISNAAGGDASAQQAIVAAAQDIINEAETDQTKARPIVNQLEANAETATQEEAPPLDLSLEFPKFCSWAPVVCEAAQVVLTFPNTLTEWWETANTKAEEWALSISEAWAAAKEWATSEPEEQDSNELEFEDLNIDADQVNLSGSSTCPQDSVSFSLMGKSVTLDMPYQPVCDALNFFKPAVLLVGAVASVYIVAGVRTKEEDQA